MTSFALGFMIISMSLVTLLTSYCLWRILTTPPPSEGDD